MLIFFFPINKCTTSFFWEEYSWFRPNPYSGFWPYNQCVENSSMKKASAILFNVLLYRPLHTLSPVDNCMLSAIITYPESVEDVLWNGIISRRFLTNVSYQWIKHVEHELISSIVVQREVVKLVALIGQETVCVGYIYRQYFLFWK